MRLSSTALDEVVRHAREAWPSECCGVLIGRSDFILESKRILNIAESGSRYQLNPAQHIASRRDARERGLEILGFYHSHPQSGATPSETDLAEATYPDHVYLIVGLRDQLAETVEARLFTLSNDGYVEVALVVVGGSG